MAVNIRYLITYFGKIHSIITLKSNYKLYTVIRLNYIQIHAIRLSRMKVYPK